MKRPTAFKTHLQQGAHNSQETFLEHGAQVIWKSVPLRPTRHLHHKAIITNLGVRADEPNTQKKMGRQKNMPQMKEQEESSEKELNEMEATKIPNSEFKTIVIRMLKKLRGKMGDLSEKLKKGTVNVEKDIETIKKNQSEMKNRISEMKNTLEEISSGLGEAED